MTIYEKLSAIQSELKAPKSQYNSFGKYNYRNCEDILEAVKPLCAKYKAVSVMGDEVIQIGERYYIKSTARLIDLESDGVVENTAYAREEAEKKGMDGSQVTGASSSYARKYALNGLFAIDDTKDSDTTNNGQTAPREATKAEKKVQPVEKNEEFKRLTKSELVQVYGVSNAEATIAWFEKKFGIVFKDWDKDATEAARAKLTEQKEKQERGKALKEQADGVEPPFSMTD
jgi:hypothetical protein